MKKISDVAGQSLKWTQPSALKKQYELRLRDELIATLSFRSALGSFATGESADGCWTMKRVGFWRTRATIRVRDSDVDIASFRDNTWTSGGTLRFADGRELLAVTSFWKSKFVFEDAQHQELILLHSGGLLHLSSTVEVRPRARAMAELPWLVLFGWYLAIQKHEDEAAVAAAASC